MCIILLLYSEQYLVVNISSRHLFQFNDMIFSKMLQHCIRISIYLSSYETDDHLQQMVSLLKCLAIQVMSVDT